jgi:Transposase DNA-binding
MNVTTFANLDAWARAQWAAAPLGDRRRAARAVRVGAALAAHPAASLPAQTQTWADLKAAYRLLNAPDVTHAALSTPHWTQTRAAASGPEPVLFLQDTTELDYTAHPHTSGLGHIGDGQGRGFELHSCRAVRPAEPTPAVLGLAYQQPWTRQEVHQGPETRTQRWARPRESAVWAQVLRAIGRPPAGATWISVSDSASDVFGFLREATALGWHCLLRLCQDRALRQADGTPTRLSRWVRALPAQAEQTSALRGRDGVPKRTVVLQLAWALGARAALCASERAGAGRGAGGGLGPALLGGGAGVAPL